MIQLDEIDHMSQDEIIERLKAHGIEVFFVPKAMIPKDYLGDISFNTRISYEETDVREALRMIVRRSMINKDPFSDE